jgi:hypothetical protein
MNYRTLYRVVIRQRAVDLREGCEWQTGTLIERCLSNSFSRQPAGTTTVPGVWLAVDGYRFTVRGILSISIKNRQILRVKYFPLRFLVVLDEAPNNGTDRAIKNS